MIRKSIIHRHSPRFLLSTLAILLMPFALGACVGVEQEVAAPPVEVVEVDDSAAAEDEAEAPAEEAEAEEESAAEEDAASEEEAPADEAMSDEVEAAAPQKLNLNTASREDFLEVPNAGEKMAKEFDEYRPYATIGQFRAAIGKYVDEEQVAAYEEYLFVPIDPDVADAATMMQIPGMTDAIAEAMVAGQPYGGAEAFLAALAGLAPEMDPAVAAGYLTQ